ncbi:MAG: Uma2 family endonuclease [Cytophagales bacterium]|nr:Uma2 family endonuclease [Cytophagales bacterium]
MQFITAVVQPAASGREPGRPRFEAGAAPAGGWFAVLARKPRKTLQASGALVKGHFYVYPDVLYTGHEAGKGERTTLKHPALLIEVLPDRTEAYDLGTKLDGYLKLPSLLYYLIVSQKAYFVRIYEGMGEKWEYRTVEGLEAAVVLPQLELSLPMAGIYEEVSPEP